MKGISFVKVVQDPSKLDAALRAEIVGFEGIKTAGDKLWVLVDDKAADDVEQRIREIVEQFNPTPPAPAEDKLAALEARVAALEAVVADMKKGKG